MGFAVVAEEVRNLAQRSAQAARDTAALIEDAIDKSTVGSRNLDQVTEAMDTVTASACRAKTLVDEVNLGSQEQARGIEQIGKAIVQMEQVTQKAAANAEESASAAEQLTAQSEALRHIVRRLTSLVHGGDAPQTSGAAPDNIPPRHGSFDVAASYAAISQKTKPRSEHLITTVAKDANALPMEEDFKPF
jgi:methyl-accepting chemotaxis protein/methyl-accepting chemotaxis protein-1 (serine sensor receptor)